MFVNGEITQFFRLGKHLNISDNSPLSIDTVARDDPTLGILYTSLDSVKCCFGQKNLTTMTEIQEKEVGADWVVDGEKRQRGGEL